MQLSTSSLLVWTAVSASFSLTWASQARDQLISLSKASGGNILLNEELFDLITSDKRDWSATVHFTALSPVRRCEPCKVFDPAYKAIGKAWTKVKSEHRDSHFFATVDFETAPDVFKKQNINTAPLVNYYPPTDGPRKTSNPSPIKYEMLEGLGPEELAVFHDRLLSTHIPYTKPVDYSKVATLVALILGAAVTVRVASPVFTSKWTWCAGTILFTLVNTGGYMFSRIRNVPRVGGDGGWVARGYQNQFGQEVTLIAGIYGTLAASFLMLTLVVPLQRSKSVQRVQVWLWSGVILIMFSLLLVIFKEKNGGYPFRLIL